MPTFHPRLVPSGLDPVDFPIVGGGERDNVVCAMRQASRRSWSVGRSHPVKAVFLAFRNTLQFDVQKLVAKSPQCSPVVEGKLPVDGLAAEGDDGHGLLLALACQVVKVVSDGETLEQFFAQSTAAAARTVAVRFGRGRGCDASEAEGPQAETAARNGVSR